MVLEKPTAAPALDLLLSNEFGPNRTARRYVNKSGFRSSRRPASQHVDIDRGRMTVRGFPSCRHKRTALASRPTWLSRETCDNSEVNPTRGSQRRSSSALWDRLMGVGWA